LKQHIAPATNVRSLFDHLEPAVMCALMCIHAVLQDLAVTPHFTATLPRSWVWLP
jgi:hypothetical protein